MRELLELRLRAALRYYPSTGLFIWVSHRYPSRNGTIAGTINSSGYVVIWFDGKLYYAHRIAWLFKTGEWPKAEIDHKDTNTTNNRWRNLRAASHRHNLQNVRKPRTDNRSGFLGVSWSTKKNRWIAAIVDQGKQYRLGEYQDPKIAHLAYVKAKRRLHKFGTL